MTTLHLHADCVINDKAIPGTYRCDNCGVELIVLANADYWEGKSGTIMAICNGGAAMATSDPDEWLDPIASRNLIKCTKE
jgi:hypothetical protein